MVQLATSLDGPCSPRAPHAPARPLPFDAVRLDGGFDHAWGERTPGAMRVWIPVATVTP
ncbi:hypothetical protein [Xylanimonas sp. McL0601]|uniref:hypothetical protein n=1 Tax=Xylanimonas sp. McL0601 TaxID=3414739 RepID=UPI003CE99F23